MKFKNQLEQQCFEIARRALGDAVTIEHNRTITIESALFPEVAAFKGPPAKEVDVLVAQLLDDPKVVLLVSCKLLGRRAEPAHVQEWCAVVQAMNKYSAGTNYLGMIISPTGFTAGCEAWATSHNVGIVPPLKGRKLDFRPDTALRMYERVLIALRARVRFRFQDLLSAPAFFNFVYSIVGDFEGHEQATGDGRYLVMPQKWASSFGEMYSRVAGRTVEDLLATDGAVVLKLVGGVALRFNGAHVEFGDYSIPPGKPNPSVMAWKNVTMDPCTLDFIKSIAVGKPVTSAGDFGGYIEVGLDGRFNLGLHPAGFHLISTEMPIEQHQL